MDLRAGHRAAKEKIDQFLPKSIIFNAILCLLVSAIIPRPENVVLAFPADTAGVQVLAQQTIFLPAVFKHPTGQLPPDIIPPPEEAGWLAYVNYYRALAGLAPVYENTSWSDGGWLHSRYMVKNDYVSHYEDPQKPWYTREGDQAARTSNLMASSDSSNSDHYAIDLWMQAPFHAVGILDPQLSSVGFGSFREIDGGLQMGASLDIIRGLQASQAEMNFPIAWPGDGTTIPLSAYYTEYPDPLSSCPGYQAPSGLPVILQLGDGNITPSVTAYSIKVNGKSLEACIFDETNYQNPDPTARRLGRNILDARDAIVLVPRSPLSPGETYSISITANGQTYHWSFKVAEEIHLAQTLLEDISRETLILR